MTKEQFIEFCKVGENTTMEYKTCESEVSHSVYESVCSMLNHNGGWILMGVLDITMSDEEILASSRLMSVDSSGKQIFKFASLLLFGTDAAIERFVPRYRFEAIFRMCTFAQYQKMDDVANRYDDRVTLRCNLIKVYDRLTEFTLRYMPDKFYIPEGSMQRVDVRLALMREIIGNLCVHTDYSSGFACFLEIFKDRVMTRNATRLIPQTPEGEISIRQLGNYTKNPLLVKVFHELDWVEDLGSGTRNILKYAPLYYPDYRIGISNGQQFVFAITYANAEEGNVGRKCR